MKNLVIAVLGLIVVLIIVFFFSRYKGNNDLTLPSPVAIGSPKPSIITKAATDEAKKISMDKLPFSVLTKDEIDGKKAVISTSKGDIIFDFYDDAPIAASNFISLGEKGFYNSLTFHRREENFVIQGGDPNGNGTGGPGYSFPDEKVTRNYIKGTVAMANAGPNTNGSQFFIMLADTPTLPKQYTIFGHVVEGQDVVDKIQVGDKMDKVIIE